MSDSEQAAKSRPTIRVDLGFPLEGHWVEIEQRALSPRNMSRMAPLLEGMDAIDLDSNSVAGVGDVFNRLNELTEFLGPFIVDCSGFIEEPYAETFGDLWTPGVMEVAQAFFQQAGGGSQTSKNSPEQSSAETKPQPA